jgi:hypothetical protein
MVVLFSLYSNCLPLRKMTDPLEQFNTPTLYHFSVKNITCSDRDSNF